MNINNFYEELLKALDIYKYLEDNKANVQELCIQLGIADTYLAHLSYESLDDIPDCVLLYLCLYITKGITNDDKSIYKNVIKFMIEYNICNKQIVNTICKNNPEREDAVLLTTYKIEFTKQNIEIESREWLIQFAVYLLIIYKEKLKMVEQERELNTRRTSNNNMKMPKMKIYNSEKIFRRYDKPTMSLDHYVQLLEKQEEVMKSMEQNAEEYVKIEVDEEEERKAEERKEHAYKKGYKKDLG